MCIAAFLACRVYIPLSLEAYEAKKKELGVDKNLTTEVSAQYRNKYMFLWDPKYLLYIHHPYNQNQLIRSFLQMEFQSGFLLANNVFSRYETFPYIFPFHNPSFLLTFQTYFWNILKIILFFYCYNTVLANFEFLPVIISTHSNWLCCQFHSSIGRLDF